jgi:hypothetical protein
MQLYFPNAFVLSTTNILSCLASDTKIFNFIFTFLKNNQYQNILIFFLFTFYITSIIYYYYSNKKNSLQYKTFLLFYINSFYFISYLLLFTNSKIIFSLFCSIHSTCQTYPNSLLVNDESFYSTYCTGTAMIDVAHDGLGVLSCAAFFGFFLAQPSDTA